MSSPLFVAGARPNFMKVAPILRELASRGLRGELVHTGQHYDYEMSGVFFEQLGLAKPDAFLQVGSGPHGVQTGKIMIAFDEYLAGRSEPPSSVVVVGDVNSTMACALVAVKRGIRVVHVEAGLRSYDRAMPEEINRLVTDSVSDLLLVSDPAGIENLRREGIAEEKVKFVGNVMIDSLVHQLPEAKALGMADLYGLSEGSYAIITLHRPSNVDVDDKLRALAKFVGQLANRLPVVFPIHPRTEKRMTHLGIRDELGSAKVTAPLGYREFLGLMSSARIAVTDSGGIQEETSFLGIPCVTLRANTERPVTITQGTNRLVGDDLALATRTVEELLATKMKPAAIDGWDGHAATRVADALLEG
jgi:UDP-N-acetylglucosamine 2-epimerase (non-hydrolysing)